jgi:putative ABC transport system ATP-binding protein
MERVSIDERMRHRPNQLSGGEQQRVTIARALSNNPDILLLDEPTGDLDTKTGHHILKLLLEMNRQEEITMIMVTHDVQLKTLADRVIHMLDGKVQHIEDIPKAEKELAFQKLCEIVEIEAKEVSDPHRVAKAETILRNPAQEISWCRPAMKSL